FVMLLPAYARCGLALGDAAVRAGLGEAGELGRGRLRQSARLVAVLGEALAERGLRQADLPGVEAFRPGADAARGDAVAGPPVPLLARGDGLPGDALRPRHRRVEVLAEEAAEPGQLVGGVGDEPLVLELVVGVGAEALGQPAPAVDRLPPRGDGVVDVLVVPG